MQESFGMNLLAIGRGTGRSCSPCATLCACSSTTAASGHAAPRCSIYARPRSGCTSSRGLKIALDNLDAVITLIRAAANPAEARSGLCTQFGLSEIQAQAILDMRLQRLTNLERDKILEEHREVTELIARLKSILAIRSEVDGIIGTELREIRDKYGDERRTTIIESTDDSVDRGPDPARGRRRHRVARGLHQAHRRDRVPRTAARWTRQSRRHGTRGRLHREPVRGVDARHDPVLHQPRARALGARCSEIPPDRAPRAARRSSICCSSGRTSRSPRSCRVSRFEEGRHVFFSTLRGTVKKTELMAYANRRAAGIVAIGLDEGDRLVGVRLVDKDQEILLSTKNGKAIRFAESDVRSMGRGAGGVRGISLEDDDEVVAGRHPLARCDDPRGLRARPGQAQRARRVIGSPAAAARASSP